MTDELDVAHGVDERVERELRARQTLAEIRLLMEMEYDFLMRPWDRHPWEMLLYEAYRYRNGAGPRPPYAFTIEACYQAVTMLGGFVLAAEVAEPVDSPPQPGPPAS